MRQDAWDDLLANCADPSRHLGWDFMACMAHRHRVNVIAFLDHQQHQDLGDGTPAAEDKWKAAIAAGQAADWARKMGKDKQGGRWVESIQHTTTQVIPRRVIEGNPFVVIYHRTNISWVSKLKKGGKGVDLKTSGGSGHYEAVVLSNGDRKEGYIGRFTEAHEAYPLLSTIADRYLSEHNSLQSSQRTEADYNAKATVVEFDILDCVGVRLKNGTTRFGKAPQCIPGLIVGKHLREECSCENRQQYLVEYSRDPGEVFPMSKKYLEKFYKEIHNEWETKKRSAATVISDDDGEVAADKEKSAEQNTQQETETTQTLPSTELKMDDETEEEEGDRSGDDEESIASGVQEMQLESDDGPTNTAGFLDMIRGAWHRKRQ